MTTSQPARRTGVGSPVRRALDRSLRTLRELHNEQVYAWDRVLQTGLPPEARTQAAAKARGGRASGSRSPVPAGTDSGDRAA